jgi:hypothetical protein
MNICEWCNRISGDVIEGLCPTCYDNKHKVLKEKICQWCFEEPALEGKNVCQACIDAESKKEDDDFDLDKWLEED